MASKPPSISEAEWRVMRVLWAKAPQTAAAIIEALAPETGWKPATVKTLLSRLVEKRAVGFDRDGKQFLYRPLADESACARAESRSLLDRVFGGALTPMLAHLVEGRRLTAHELTELRQLLDEAERGSADNPSPTNRRDSK